MRPGETDPDPETKPARPDAVDMDEDEKEMLSEARARLANTQGKKAKRKARERQLEDSRRLALLQKRRELKHAGINIKLTNRRKGEMDYNADIPFEKAPALGFYDTAEETFKNEKQREGIDPRKSLSHTKRKGFQEDEDGRKRRKANKDKTGTAAASASVAKAGQLARIREAEQLSKRRPLNLPAPQVSEHELEEILKMGMTGERATKVVGSNESGTTKGLIGNYSGIVRTGQPIRTPRAAPTEDCVANEIKNIRALTETQSSLLGGDNTPLHEGSGSTGFSRIVPNRTPVLTPNTIMTPFRKGNTELSKFARSMTPLRTPRDSLAINTSTNLISAVSLQHQRLSKDQLTQAFASLPKPKRIELEAPLDPEEEHASEDEPKIFGDAAECDFYEKTVQERKVAEEMKRRSSTIQRSLPRSSKVNTNEPSNTASIETHASRLISQEMGHLMGCDSFQYPVKGGTVTINNHSLNTIEAVFLDRARKEILLELPQNRAQAAVPEFEAAWACVHVEKALPGVKGCGVDSRVICSNAHTVRTTPGMV